MIVLNFRAHCVHHDLDKLVVLKGKDTPRQVKKGYDSLDRQMRAAGCDDYNATYSVSHDYGYAKMPGEYNASA